MKLQRISLEFLKENYRQSTNIPNVYWHPFPLVRELFYRRLETILKLMPTGLTKKQIVCDFGGGGGIFLPTLSKYFLKVVIIDLETQEAELIVRTYNLRNVKIIKSDALVNSFPDRYFDTVVAADALEHFKNLKEAIKEIARLLRPQGLLLVSLPTENLLYQMGRGLLGFKKPADHYYSAKEVEEALKKEAFQIIKKIYLPFNFSPLGLFLVLKAKKEL